MKAKDFLVELDAADIGRYNPEEDKLSRFHYSDKRKPVVTFRDLNRLKKIRATRKIEELQTGDLLSVMYSQPEGDESSGGL
jgi:hypothetical protein